tara:strand:+ start:1245 stop:1625 length:381 start_codon:yes stop_codon:yes gene_type:complete
MTESKHIFDIISADPKLQTVNGGWADFSITISAGLHTKAFNCWGTCNFDTYEIQLEKSMKDAPARETLLHEICHMFLELCGLGGGEEESEESITTTNERLTITMSRAMITFSRLNPELAKELLCLN